MKAPLPFHSKLIIFFLVFAPSFIISYAQNSTPLPDQKLTQGFVENIGQVVDQNGVENRVVKYLLARPGLNVQLRTNGFSYDTYVQEHVIEPSQSGIALVEKKGEASQLDKLKFHRVDISLEGASMGELVAEGEYPDKINYAGARDFTVSHFKKIRYKNIYPNIDLEFYVRDQGIEYDFVIHPGGDASNIKLSYEGQLGLTSIGPKKIQLSLAHGSLIENIPSSFIQESNQSVDVNYQVNGQTLSFDVPDFDKTKTLVIDPTPNLLFGTYYGGTGSDQIRDVHVDASGNVYVTGYTNSSASIATAGTFQSTLGGGFDAFLTKFNSAGVRQWATYFGGAETDVAYGVTLTTEGNAYIAGYTFSDGMATSGVHQTTRAGGADAFVAKFSGAAGLRIWSTYYGGTGNDYAYGIDTDDVPSVFLAITGYTFSSDGIASTGAVQATFGGGTSSDAFLAQFGDSGLRDWGTYLGSTGTDRGYDVRWGVPGSTSSAWYITGYTTSTTNIASAGSFQATFGGSFDGYLGKYTSSGARTWCTYYGGTGDDVGIALAVKASTSEIYLGGYATSTGSIATSGVHQTTLSGDYDAYVAKFSDAGTRVWGTYIGGSGFDGIYGLAIDNASAIVAVGETESTSGIATASAHQTSRSGSYDAMIVKLTDAGLRTWGTYYGGTFTDFGWRVDTDASNNIYAIGNTLSEDGISTLGVHQPSLAGLSNYLYDGFIAKFDAGTGSVTPATEPTAQPTAFLSGSITANSYAVSFTLAVGAPTGYIAVRKAGSAPTTDPVDGTVYTKGATLGDGVIAYIGSVNNFNEANLNGATQYFYKIYSFNGSGGTNNYRVTTPLQGSVTTLGSAEPSAQPTAFSATSITGTSATVGFTAAAGAPAGYLILRREDSYPVNGPVDGVSYTVGTTIGSGTIVSVGTATSISQTALSAQTAYYYNIYSYNGSGTTINYRQTTPLQGTFTTITDGPTISSFTPSAGAIGATVTITGTGFSPTPSQNTVRFTNNISATVTSSTTTSLVVTVPVGATTGPISVTVNSISVSSSTNFTVETPSSDLAFLEVSNPASSDLWSVNFATTTLAYAVGESATALKSTDSGASWTTMTTPITTGIFWNVYALNSTTAFIMGDDGVLLKTTNAGSTWTSAASNSALDIYAMDFPSSLIGYYCGASGSLYKSIDGGTTWTPQVSGQPSTYLKAISFASDNIGVAAGNGGLIRTTNGGTTWTDIDDLEYGSITFASATVAYAVGANGIIQKSTDAGATWISQNSVTSEYLWGVHFINEQIGFAVGENGTIVKTANGGSTWEIGTTDTFEDLLSVHFGSATLGVAVGNLGTILVTEPELPALVISSQNLAGEIPVDGTTSASITINGTDLPRINSVVCYVVGIVDLAEGDFSNVQEIFVTVGSNPTLTVTLTDDGSDPLGYFYYFSIEYDGGLRFKYSNDGYAYLKYSDATSLSMPQLKAGTTVNDYQLISVPLQLTSPAVTSAFDELGPVDKKKWRMFSGDGSVELSGNSGIAIGKGYWLITKEAPSIDIGEGRTVGATPDAPAALTLSTGWNLIGNPYNFPVTWTPGSVVGPLYKLINGGYTTATILEPFVGYYVFSSLATTIDIPIAGGFTDAARLKNTSFEQNATSWELPIEVSHGETSSLVGGIGIHPAADYTFDSFDRPTPPMPEGFDMFAMAFERPELPYTLSKEIIPTVSQYVWDFEVDQSPSTSAVTLRWDKNGIQGIGNGLYLVDEEKMEVVNMLTQTQHQTMTNRRLKIVYGDLKFLESVISFEGTGIGKVYPNPSQSGDVYIPLSLTEPAMVKVSIYDALGRSIVSEEQWFDKGYQRYVIKNVNGASNQFYWVITELMNTTQSGKVVQKIMFK